MISSEVQRTLVKSPPELWAELSDPAALSRHLGELGEIRIIRTEPERTVEWAAENTTGTVSIKPSAWGTNVKLTVTRELAEPPLAPDSRPEARAAIEPACPPRATGGALQGEPTCPPPGLGSSPQGGLARAERRAPPEHTTTLEPAPTTFEPEIEREPRRGFFARLFGLRRREYPVQIETVRGRGNRGAAARRLRGGQAGARADELRTHRPLRHAYLRQTDARGGGNRAASPGSGARRHLGGADGGRGSGRRGSDGGAHSGAGSAGGRASPAVLPRLGDEVRLADGLRKAMDRVVVLRARSSRGPCSTWFGRPGPRGRYASRCASLPVSLARRAPPATGYEIPA